MRTQKKLKIFKNNKKSCLFKFRYQCYNHGLPITLFCENCDEPICKNCSEVIFKKKIGPHNSMIHTTRDIYKSK
jgi:hypothetical protein